MLNDIRYAFRQTDGADSPRVVVVNQAFAQEYLGENPIGSVIIGTVLTFILGQALKAAIEVRFNPVLLAFVSFSLFLTTLLAASVPALRAARVDPTIALREE